MSRTAYSIRRLRELAMQRLGALAAQLKTRDELYDALAEHAPDAVGLREARGPRPETRASTIAAHPPPEAPRPVAVKSAKKAPASPPAPAITAPQRLPKKPRPAPDREVVRDFFVPPGSRAIPASFGDDRVMLFPRDPTGIFVSWDLSHGTYAQGGLRLVLRTHDGQELWAEDIHTFQGSVSISGDFGGASIRALIERGGQGIGASPAVLMPGSAQAFAERWRVRVAPDARLPLAPQKVGPSHGPPEPPPAALGEASRLLHSSARGLGGGPGGAPSRLG